MWASDLSDDACIQGIAQLECKGLELLCKDLRCHQHPIRFYVIWSKGRTFIQRLKGDTAVSGTVKPSSFMPASTACSDVCRTLHRDSKPVQHHCNQPDICHPPLNDYCFASSHFNCECSWCIMHRGNRPSCVGKRGCMPFGVMNSWGPSLPVARPVYTLKGDGLAASWIAPAPRSHMPLNWSDS